MPCVIEILINRQHLPSMISPTAELPFDTSTSSARLGEERRAEESRAEQSRAEQSRAEQSRAKQSRAEQRCHGAARGNGGNVNERFGRGLGTTAQRAGIGGRQANTARACWQRGAAKQPPKLRACVAYWDHALHRAKHRGWEGTRALARATTVLHRYRCAALQHCTTQNPLCVSGAQKPRAGRQRRTSQRPP